MTRSYQIAVLDALLQELRGEQKVTDWIESHTSATVSMSQSADDGLHFVCEVSHHGKVIARAKGDDEAEARKQAFSAIFTNEAAGQAG